ncbi:MAG: FAD:protein FMN transferase [Clostridia bacterium]|nr:FAD:protein FMN transferase [Clostridia bacterium]
MKNNIKKHIAFYVLLACIVAMLFIVQNSKYRVFKETFTDYLDTVCDISIISKTDKPLAVCEEYLKFCQSEFSADDENSTLFKVNNSDGVAVSKDLQEVLSSGSEFSRKHPEYFSIYLDKLIKLWDISNSPDSIPSQESIELAKASRDFNLGAIAKGYITDRLKEKLLEQGVNSALINLGGNTYAMGKKLTGENWKIGIQSPKDESTIIGYVTAENLAVVTSGDYQRYAEIDGKRYHHILNPLTGYPADSGVHSVTVICESAELADVLSTAAFVAGVENGHKLLESYGAMGVFITEDTVYFSKSLENIFKQIDFSYKYKFLH